jgi:hypothetical protein
MTKPSLQGPQIVVLLPARARNSCFCEESRSASQFIKFHNETTPTNISAIVTVPLRTDHCHLFYVEAKNKWAYIFSFPYDLKAHTRKTFCSLFLSMYRLSYVSLFITTTVHIIVMPSYGPVIRSKTYRGYVKPRIIPNAIYNVIFV